VSNVHVIRYFVLFAVVERLGAYFFITVQILLRKVRFGHPRGVKFPVDPLPLRMSGPPVSECSLVRAAA
jgi:hypothetical protein